MKAKDYVVIWTEKKYGGSKEIGDWTTDDVIQFAEDFAEKRYIKITKTICENCGDWYGININHKCYKCLQGNFIQIPKT